jgi:hypothetical protein
MITRRTKRLLIVLPAVLIGCFLAAAMCHLPSPEGTYYDPNIVCIGDAYWVYHDGQLRLKTPESDDLICVYSKGKDGWVYRGAHGGTGQFTFTATVFGISGRDLSTGQTQRFLFRRSFAWVPKTRSWIQEHGL